METIRIEDETVAFEFSGERIAGPVSTRLDPRKRQRARWLEAELFRREDGSYVYCQVNYSTVWHYPDGAAHVRKPLVIPASQLPDRPVYCGVLPARAGRDQCPPLTLEAARVMDIPAEVIAEAPQHRILRLPGRDAVIRQLVMANRRDEGVSAAVSEPMRKLLAQAAQNDPAFRDGSKTVVPM